MSVFSAANILRFQNDGEDAFNYECPCIVDRVGLSITSGTSQYALPNYVISIKRVTYRGWKLYPMPHRELRQSYLSGAQSGRPYWYIFNNISQQQIKFFPVPAETLSAPTTGLWGSDTLKDGVILEFFRTPDDNGVHRIPVWFRRRLLKVYVNMRCFTIDSKGANAKAAKYWTEKWMLLNEVYRDLLNELNTKPRRLIANGNVQSPFGFTPPPPLLPINRYGIAVDDISG